MTTCFDIMPLLYQNQGEEETNRLNSLAFHGLYRFEEKPTNDNKGDGGRKPRRNMDAETVSKHNDSQNENRIHSAIFQKNKFLDPVNVPYRQLSYHHRADTV